MQTAVLEPLVVGDIAGRFHVPSYQRGYRWGVDEVTRLLDDIRNRSGKYYLQPIVVKTAGDGWELIDGQQRLTTLFLILRQIRNHLPTARISYSLEYETRQESAEFLENPTRERRGENIDFFHIFNAFECIDRWFREHDDPALAAVDFYQALSKDVHIIWYQAPSDVDSRDLFTRLNIGRIPLTDAELVKATLLSRARRPHEIAAQWDSIEHDLRAPEVWSFVTGRAGSEPTHIELLLNTVSGDPKGVGTRPSFYTFETLRQRIEEKSPESVWNDVVDLHSLVLGWFDQSDCFHKVGYLVATGSSLLSLVSVAKGLTKTTFDSALNELIRGRVNLSRGALRDLSYDVNHNACERVLLLMNVETVRRRASSERYSFSAHATQDWSLEHINAQSAERLNRAEQWTEWLRLHRAALSAIPTNDPEGRTALEARIDDGLLDITEEKFRRLEQEIVTAFRDPQHSQDDVAHAISNLALLDARDNSALSNSCFEVKRREVLRLDRLGRFIPPSTRNVFLKYYTTAQDMQVHFWGPQDRAAYLEAMEELVVPFLTEDVDATDD